MERSPDLGERRPVGFCQTVPISGCQRHGQPVAALCAARDGRRGGSQTRRILQGIGHGMAKVSSGNGGCRSAVGTDDGFRRPGIGRARLFRKHFHKHRQRLRQRHPNVTDLWRYPRRARRHSRPEPGCWQPAEPVLVAFGLRDSARRCECSEQWRGARGGRPATARPPATTTAPP